MDKITTWVKEQMKNLNNELPVNAESEPKEEHDAFQENKEADIIPGQDDGETLEENPGDLRE